MTCIQIPFLDSKVARETFRDEQGLTSLGRAACAAVFVQVTVLQLIERRLESGSQAKGPMQPWNAQTSGRNRS